MADQVLSAFLQVLFENVVNLIQSELELKNELETEVASLIGTLRIIGGFLEDAEGKQQSQVVGEWLEQLKDIVYDANDLLDEFSIEAARCQVVKFSQVRNSLSIVNPKRASFRHEMLDRVKSLKKRLDGIKDARRLLGLKVSGGAIQQDVGGGLRQSQTTSLNPPSAIGRDEDKRRIIDLLLKSSEGTYENNISVIPLLGMGGLGKTTLAKLIINDELVEKNFELRLWVHVTGQFNVNKITEAILESIDGSPASYYTPLNLDSLQKNMQSRLGGKKYLLVLDDVWNEKPQEWTRLMDSLLCGAKGSKILVTTRSEEVAKLPGCMPPYHLQVLSDDDCWSLFRKHALGPSMYQRSELDDISREIMDKCRGLPLAAEAMGFRFQREQDRSKWGDILRDERWEFSGGDSDIFKSIGLSYHNLDPQMRICFAYCSIIPKGFVFDKELVVQLWMSQNFIQPKGEERIEDTAERYFNHLVKWSFFEKAHFDCKHRRDRYTMHHVIYEFAQHVSGRDCSILEIGKQSNISEKTRHASLLYGSFNPSGSRQASSSRGRTTFQTVYACKGLYTLVVLGGSLSPGMEVPLDLGAKLQRLRTLDLSDLSLSVLPESIGYLKHLRYLQLRNNNIARLPESVATLYNLQTLGLANCYALQQLPRDTRHLRKLRHLDLHLDDDWVNGLPRNSKLTSMPKKLGILTDLQKLSRFVVSVEKGCGLGELQNLNSIRGELRISNLNLVQSAKEGTIADLSSKEFLQRLEFGWSDEGNSSSDCFNQRVAEGVLKSLEPHTNLEELKIVRYRGAVFPPWITQSNFTSLVSLNLTDCKECEVLPPLGQLPVLNSLCIQGMDGVKSVDCAFCGHGTRRFPSLQKLQFRGMRKMQVWCGDETCELPSLRELVFKDCVDLRQLTGHKLPSLAKLEIDGSPWFIGLGKFPSLCSLNLNDTGEWIWSWPYLTSLTSLSISNLPTITATSRLNGGHCAIRRLEINHCHQLTSLPENWPPASITYFAIRDCSQLSQLPAQLMHLKALEILEIEHCAQLHALPELPTKLQFLTINLCHALSQRYQGVDWGRIARNASVWIDKRLVASSSKS